jgi:hypothetical protein
MNNQTDVAGASMHPIVTHLFPEMALDVEEESDVVFTPIDVAKDVVQWFQPYGKVLDPCKGNGAFLQFMPGADWCEIREGRDFFAWTEQVDWIVSNPPYSIFSKFMRHSMTVARNIVYVIPVNKVYNSDRTMREIWDWGGVPEIHVIGPGAALKFPIGFCIGAVHFQRGYRGSTQVTFREREKP